MENEELEKKSFTVEFLLTIVTRMSFTTDTEGWLEVMRFMAKQPEPLQIHPIQRDWLMDLCREHLVKQLPWLEEPWIMEKVAEIEACPAFAIKKIKADAFLDKVRTKQGKEDCVEQIPGETTIPDFYELMEKAGIKILVIIPPKR